MPGHAGSGLRLGRCAILLRGTERITVIRIPKRVAVIGSIRRCWRHVGSALRSGLHEWIAVIRLRILLIVLLISTHIRIPEERIARPLRLLSGSLPVRAILRLRRHVRRTIRSIVRGCGAISRLRRHGTVRTIFRCRTVLLGRRILRGTANHGTFARRGSIIRRIARRSRGFRRSAIVRNRHGGRRLILNTALHVNRFGSRLCSIRLTCVSLRLFRINRRHRHGLLFVILRLHGVLVVLFSHFRSLFVSRHFTNQQSCRSNCYLRVKILALEVS